MTSQLQWANRTLPKDDDFKTGEILKTGYEGLGEIANKANKSFSDHMQVVKNSVIKSLDNKEKENDKIMAELSKIIPKAGKAIQAGIKNKAEQIRAEEFLGQNAENSLDTEKKFGTETNFETVNRIINTSSLEASAIFEQDGDVDGALAALKLAPNVEKAAALELYLGPLREELETTLVDREFNIDGEWVSLQNATDEQKVKIKRKINAALYANLKETGQFTDKELYFGFVKPLKKKIEDEYVLDAAQTLKDKNLNLKLEKSKLFNSELRKWNFSGKSFALSNRLNADSVTKANLANTLDNGLAEIEFLFLHNKINHAQAMAAVNKSGVITRKDNGKRGTIAELFPEKVETFKGKIKQIESQKQTTLEAENQGNGTAFSDRWSIKLGEIDNINDYAEALIQLRSEAKNSGIDQYYFSPEIKNILSRGGPGNDKHLAKFAILMTRKKNGFEINSWEVANLPSKMQKEIGPTFGPDEQQTILAALRTSILEPSLVRAMNWNEAQQLELRTEAVDAIITDFNNIYETLGPEEGNRAKALNTAIENYQGKWKPKLEGLANNPKDKKFEGTVAELQGLLQSGHGIGGESSAEINQRAIGMTSYLRRLRDERKSSIDSYADVLNDNEPNIGETPQTIKDLIFYLNTPGATIPSWYKKIARQIGGGVTPQMVALSRAQALGEKYGISDDLITNKVALYKKVDENILQLEKANFPHEAQNILSTLVSNPEARDSAYNGAILPRASRLENPYDHIQVEGGGPFTIRGKEVKLSETTVEDIGKAGRSGKLFNIGAFGMDHSQFEEVLKLYSQEERTELLKQPFDKKMQEKFFRNYLGIRYKLKRALNGTNTSWNVESLGNIGITLPKSMQASPFNSTHLSPEVAWLAYNINGEET